jgi:hypothetical protein
MVKKKKKWCKPKLIVLMRGKPEDAVLLYCAWSPKYGGTDIALMGCYSDDPGNPFYNCLSCFTTITS